MMALTIAAILRRQEVVSFEARVPAAFMLDDEEAFDDLQKKHRGGRQRNRYSRRGCQPMHFPPVSINPSRAAM
jgi:hypothetical protein